MYTSTVFSQLLSFIPKYRFARLVTDYQSDKFIGKLSTWNQLVILLYAQATGKDSLRAIETGLKVHTGLWSHLGIKTVSRSTMSHVSARRDYRVFEKLFYVLLAECRSCTESRSFTFDNPLYSLDSTMVDLCLSLCDWAQYRTGKGAIKLHTLLDNRTLLPELLVVTPGKHNDGKIARESMDKIYGLEPGSIVVFDRAYIDYAWWNRLDQHGLFFVSRLKKSQQYVVHKRRSNRTSTDILQDDLIYIGITTTPLVYDAPLRLVRYQDKETGKVYRFVTNNHTLTALDIAAIYKDRWQIELFFKWIKQNLKIKSFLGTNPNAVQSQIWVAMIYYLLLVYIHFQTRYAGSLLEFTRLIQESLLLRRPLIDLLSSTADTVRDLSVQETLF